MRAEMKTASASSATTMRPPPTSATVVDADDDGQSVPGSGAPTAPPRNPVPDALSPRGQDLWVAWRHSPVTALSSRCGSRASVTVLSVLAESNNWIGAPGITVLMACL